MKYVCIGAHPDDPDLYMGATAMKLIAMGHEVKFIAMCNGDAGHQSMTREALAKCRILDCHASQFYEWLPWTQGRRDFDASNLTWEQKREHLGHWLERFRIAADDARQVLIETYGDDGRAIRYAETFELTQYGRQVSVSDFRRIMAGLEPLTDEVVQLD